MPCEAVGVVAAEAFGGSASSHPTSGLPSRPRACGSSMRPLMVLDDHARTQQVPDGVEVGIVGAPTTTSPRSAPSPRWPSLRPAPPPARWALPMRPPRPPRRTRTHCSARPGLARLTVAAAAQVTGVVVAVRMAPTARRCERDRGSRDHSDVPTARTRGRRDRRAGRRRPRAGRRHRVLVGRRRRCGPGVHEGRIPTSRHRLRGLRRDALTFLRRRTPGPEKWGRSVVVAPLPASEGSETHKDLPR